MLFNTVSLCFDRIIFPGCKFFHNICSVASSIGTIASLLDVQRSTRSYQPNNVPYRYGFLPWNFFVRVSIWMCTQGTTWRIHLTTERTWFCARVGELTWVVLYVVDLEFHRCVNFPVALTLLVEGPYGEFDVVLDV